jgi:hypothetical protein
VQLVGQVDAPPQRYGAQPTPVEPAVRFVQVPSEVAPRETRQTSQPPVQAPVQQMPSAQAPDEHSLAAEQATPRPFLATQTPPVQ